MFLTPWSTTTVAAALARQRTATLSMVAELASVLAILAVWRLQLLKNQTDSLFLSRPGHWYNLCILLRQIRLSTRPRLVSTLLPSPPRGKGLGERGRVLES